MKPCPFLIMSQIDKKDFVDVKYKQHVDISIFLLNVVERFSKIKTKLNNLSCIV